jgi:hypothetical protein
MSILSKLVSQNPGAPPSVSFTSRGEQFVFSDGSSSFVGGCVWGGQRNECLTLIASSIHHLAEATSSGVRLTDMQQDIIANQVKQALDSAGYSYRVVVSRQ